LALRATTPRESESVATLVTRVRADIAEIVHAEVRLVRLRIDAGIAAAKAAGSGLACAVVLGLAGFGAVVAGAILVLATRIPAWIAAFAVGGGLLVVAAIVAAVEIRVLTKGVERALAPPELEERYG
jgi:hypothetical protein